MTYDPKIYIRDYPAATVHALVKAADVIFTGHPVEVLRHVVAYVQGPEDNFLLLQGDMQSGSDRLLLQGDMQSGSDRLLLNQSPYPKVRFTTFPIEVAFGVTEVDITMATIEFTTNPVETDFSGKLLLQGDMQSGADHLLLQGDMQSDVDVLLTNIAEP